MLVVEAKNLLTVNEQSVEVLFAMHLQGVAAETSNIKSVVKNYKIVVKSNEAEITQTLQSVNRLVPSV